MAEENSEVALSGGPSGVTASYKGKKMAEVISVGLLLLCGVLAYAFWQHKDDTKETSNQIVTAIKEMSLATRANVEAQREMNCLLSLPPDKREAAYTSP
jgi:hypothetical protein